MDVFHVVIDTSVLRQAHFQTSAFEKLLRRAQKGTLKIYIPHIVLEEQRTRMLEDMLKAMDMVTGAYKKLTERPYLGFFTASLPDPILALWKSEEVIQNSRDAFDKFLEKNKIERLHITEKHATNAWTRYFDVTPPFNRRQEREDRLKDIPDSWILEAALEVKQKRGRHCALVGDGALKDALREEEFEIYGDVASLDDEIEKSTAVTTGLSRPPVVDGTAWEQLNNSAFRDVGVALLGLNEVLGAPGKDDLLTQLERGGIERRIVEHEAQRLVLLGLLDDSGNHFIPTDRALAQQASEAKIVGDILLKIL